MKVDEFPVDLFLLKLDEYGLLDANDVFAQPPLSPDKPVSAEVSPSWSPQPGSSGTVTPTGSTPSKPQKIPRHKRDSHISAEQRRRCKIQRGFEELHTLVPAIAESSGSGGKDSKAAKLFKTADYARHLSREAKDLQKEANALRKEMEELQNEISQCQSAMPASGLSIAATTGPQDEKPIQQMFEDYVRARTYQNWKFWIFGMLIRPLFESFNRMVTGGTLEELSRGVIRWLDQHCTLITLRPVVLDALRFLSTKTSIMTTPQMLPAEALQAVIHPPNESPSFSSGTPAGATETQQMMQL